MRGELAKYRLRATRRPADTAPVASMVLVRNEAGEAGYCYANFSDEFASYVGKRLPRGVSLDDPACITVTFRAETGDWCVGASYLDGTSSVLLWRTDTRPSWLNFHRMRKS